MALIKSITNDLNQTFAYHKIVFEGAFLTFDYTQSKIMFWVKSYKDKATRESIDPVYEGVLFKRYEFNFPDIRTDQTNVGGLYSLLKAHADFVDATDDL